MAKRSATKKSAKRTPAKAKQPARKTNGPRGARPPKLPFRLGTGWLPEPPDDRDFTASRPQLADVADKLALKKIARPRPLPRSVDLSQWAGPVLFQGGFNTCNVHVVAGLVAYFEKKVHDKDIAASRLFLYKVAKNFLQSDDDAGVYIRQVMGVLKLIGVPPERYWPYPDPGTYKKPRTSDPLLQTEPPAFCYAVASDYRAIRYYRLDEPGQNPAELLHLAKSHLAAQVPFAFGFPLYQLVEQAKTTGRIAYPSKEQDPLANHAVIAIGYDDAMEIGAGVAGASKTRGAFKIKNSWSEQWGDGGYGWLPYEYLLAGHTRDFWTLLRSEWIDTGSFELLG